MPRYPANAEAILKKTIHDCRAVVVVGTGMSIAASQDPATGKPHPHASWVGLLESGLEWLKEHKHISEAKAAAHLTLLHDDPDTYSFITAAQHITRLMGGADSVHYAKWLEQTIGTIKAHNQKGLEAIEALRIHGNLIATTNYDGLLLGDCGSLKPVTWIESDEFMRTARDKETDRILYLHGYWRQPQSVILDWTSYQQVIRDHQYRDDLSSVWKMTTWVYVGIGINGLNDPDVGLLLESHGKRARQTDLWDFCLVRSDQREEFQAYFDKLKLNICAVSFGASHDDLPDYLRSLLPAPSSSHTPAVVVATGSTEPGSVPKAPAFYAEPDYIGSHRFVGRSAQLQELDDWAKPADPTNLLLFEAIGGNGKSMLTWEWVTNHATQGRKDWAGRFWYSFYERGAIMADFCQRALAYMTGQPLKELRKKKTAELKESLLALLHKDPWLFVLDGLERVLVAYHRVDAAEMRDEDAENPKDKIAHRDPRDAIRDEDNDLLRALAAATPSKILVSSRLTPRVLLNASGQPIPGTKRITLPGLRPSDAELLLRSCGIEGDSAAIQSYLTTNCDNHPLVIGILGGLINNYLPARGNFDNWVTDPEGGAKLDLASLDLVQRRNHILRAAFAALPPMSRQLLSTLALLSESVNYDTLTALNPHLPPELEEVEKPVSPEEAFDWYDDYSDEEKIVLLKEYDDDLEGWREYQRLVQLRLKSVEYNEAPKKLVKTVADLEQRGLLQYDNITQRYDLHPVVRGVTAGEIQIGDKEQFGERVVDHFSSLPQNPYEQAETLEDLRPTLNIVRTLLKLGRFQEAADACKGGLITALLFNVEAYAEILSLIQPFFSGTWGRIPKVIDSISGSILTNSAGVALHHCGEYKVAVTAYSAKIISDLNLERWGAMVVTLRNYALSMSLQGGYAKALKLNALALDVAKLLEDDDLVLLCRMDLFADQIRIGKFAGAEVTWKLLCSTPPSSNRGVNRPGRVEFHYTQFQHWKGTLQENDIIVAERLVREHKNRVETRELCKLRGAWRLEQGEWRLATVSFAEAVRMARERSLIDTESETGLALAKFHLGQLVDPQREAERLAQLRHPAHRLLAQLLLALNNPLQAKKHALAAYRCAWGDGEPYVHRYELSKTTELLQQMNVPIPKLPPYDSTKEDPFPWEGEIRKVIEELTAEKIKHLTDIG